MFHRLPLLKPNMPWPFESKGITVPTAHTVIGRNVQWEGRVTTEVFTTKFVHWPRVWRPEQVTLPFLLEDKEALWDQVGCHMKVCVQPGTFLG